MDLRPDLTIYPTEDYVWNLGIFKWSRLANKSWNGKQQFPPARSKAGKTPVLNSTQGVGGNLEC